MRIDKYLWSIRLFKTRNTAAQACKKGHIKVNGHTVKPSREVYPSDTISARKNQITHSLLVLDLPPSRVGAKLVDMYRKDTTPASAFEHSELARLTKHQYRKKGLGRPTKKDRRDMEDYLDSD